MMHRFLPLLIIGISAASCSPKESPLVGKWQAETVHNTLFEQLMKDQQNNLDTMGLNTTAAANDSLYGTHNLDSLRTTVKAAMKLYRQRQEEATRYFSYEFRPDSVVIIHTMDQVDSARWYFEEADVLVLDERKLKGSGDEILRLEVLKIKDSVLQVRNTDPSNIITTTFRKEK